MSLRLIVVALFLITAAALAMIAYQVAQPVVQPMAERVPTPAPAPVNTVAYLVTAHPLPAGTLARDDDFATKAVAPGQVPANAVMDGPDVRAGLRGALIKRYLDAGAPVMMTDILRPRDRGFLASVLAPGTRAVSVGVDAVTGVAGLIWPGDRVDVILTQEMDPALAPVAHRVLSETVLTDIRVIAVDQEIVQGASSTAGVTGHTARTVTLQVTADKAEKLTVAQRIGHLALAIRAADDGPASRPDQADSKPTVFGGDVSPALSHATEPIGARVQVIQGDQRSEVSFR